MGSIGIASPTTIDPVPFGLDSGDLKTKEARIADLVINLLATWSEPSSDDKTHFQLYMGLAQGILETASEEFKAHIAAYKHLLKKDHSDDVFKIIFLLRRQADQYSFYGVINAWSTLALATQEKIFSHLPTTYTFIASGSIKDNQAFAKLLADRDFNNLPDEFKKITNLLDEKEKNLYLHALEHAVINTIAVRSLLQSAEIL